MSSFFKKFRSKKFLAALAGVFIIGIVLAYGIITLGGPSVWRALAQIFPLPAATVDDHKVSIQMVSTAEKLGAPEPLTFAVKQAAIKALAEKQKLSVAQSEIDAELKRLPGDWQKEVRAKEVDTTQFIKLYIEPQILKEKMIVTISKPGQEVEQVKKELLAGVPFEDIAEKYSDDKVTAVFGGDLGYVTENEVDQRLWVRAAGLNNGQWTGPITTPEGFIFVKRIISQPGRDGEPEKLNLRVIVLDNFNFDTWLEEQMKNMNIKMYINN